MRVKMRFQQEFGWFECQISQFKSFFMVYFWRDFLKLKTISTGISSSNFSAITINISRIEMMCTQFWCFVVYAVKFVVCCVCLRLRFNNNLFVSTYYVCTHKIRERCKQHHVFSIFSSSHSLSRSLKPRQTIHSLSLFIPRSLSLSPSLGFSLFLTCSARFVYRSFWYIRYLCEPVQCVHKLLHAFRCHSKC